MADGTSVVSDRWGTSAGPRALRERSQYASRLRLPAAAENRRNCSQMSPCAGRLPSGRGPNADRPFDEPTTSTARRVAAATWMMSSTTVASRAYAVVPARRSRWSHGGASRPSSAPAAGSARHRADASRRDRAARQPRPTTCIVPEVVSAWLSCSRGSEHSTPPVSSAGPAASFGLRWSRCPCRSLRTKSWRRRCSSRSSSLSLICRASLDERKALASAKTASAAAHVGREARSRSSARDRRCGRRRSNVRPVCGRPRRRRLDCSAADPPPFTPCLVNVPMAWAKPRPTAWIASEALVSTPWVALANDSTRLACRSPSVQGGDRGSGCRVSGAIDAG